MDQVAQEIAALTYERLDFSFYISAWCILIYDYFLTLHLEIELIWFSKWNYTKVIVLLVRYLPFLSPIFIIMNIFVNVSGGLCVAVTMLPTLLILLTVLLSEVILAVRTWAVWGQNKIVGAIIVVSQIATIIIVSILEANYFKDQRYGPGCSSSSSYTRGAWASYTVMAIFESIVLTLIMTSAFLSYRSGGYGGLSKVVHRDGIMSYIYLLCLTFAILIMNLLSPFALKNVLAATFQVMYSVLTVRIVFTIRTVARQTGAEEELHTNIPSLVFVEGSGRTARSGDSSYDP